MNFETVKQINCAYCEKEFIPNQEYDRFCSKRCTKLFSSKYQLVDSSEFDLSTELARLQATIQQVQKPGTNWSEGAGLAFYESVFKQLSLIVKWINSQANQPKVDKDAATEIETLERQYFTMLKKAADLKKENTSLKNQISTLKTNDAGLARILLGVSENAKKDDLKTAFKTKVKLLHPDLNSGDADVFKAVKKAFDVLMHE